MLDKKKNLDRIQSTKIISVIRAANAEQALKITDAVKKGGIDLIEITMTVPGAIDVLKELRSNFNQDEILLGAGSVLDAETARSCILAGAEFIVSPILNEKMIKLCNRYQKVVAPGAFTPTEVYKSLEAGADIVKIFPASVVGPKMIKSIRGPIPQADLMPTGGINIENINEWIEAGSIAAGVGSAITGPAKKGNYQEITKKAEAFVKKINEL